MEDKRVVLITGASSGIGKASASYLARRGCRVFGTSRYPERLMPADSGSDSLEMIKMDVDSDASVKRAVELIHNETGRLDVVVNNAGIGIAGSIEDTSIEEAEIQFNTNFFGVFRVCREVIPIMRRQGQGYIITISSLGGVIGLPFQGFYSASKFAVEGLSEALRVEVRPFGIKVVLIEPGDFCTSFTAHRQIVGKGREGSAYRGKFERVLKVIEDSERKGGSPEKIGRLIGRIIKNDSPRLRYRIGPGSTLVGLKRFVPVGVSEFAIGRFFNL